MGYATGTALPCAGQQVMERLDASELKHSCSCLLFSLLGGAQVDVADLHGLRWLWHGDRTGGTDVLVAVLE